MLRWSISYRVYIPDNGVKSLELIERSCGLKVTFRVLVRNTTRCAECSYYIGEGGGIGERLD